MFPLNLIVARAKLRIEIEEARMKCRTQGTEEKAFAEAEYARLEAQRQNVLSEAKRQRRNMQKTERLRISGRLAVAIDRAFDRQSDIQNARAFLAEQTHGDDFAGLDEHGRPVYRGKTRIPKTNPKLKRRDP